MHVDPELLRHQYASLSNAALLDIDRSDLIAEAQQCYDEEITRRRLKRSNSEAELERHAHSCHEAKPAWFDESAEVYSVNSRVDLYGGKNVDAAREVLEAAGIPCYLEFCEDPPSEDGAPPEHYWRLLVPGMLNIRATSVLDRDLFNDEFEALWKTQMEMLSNEELIEAEPKEVFCGLFDRIDRVVRAHKDELSRCGLK